MITPENTEQVASDIPAGTVCDGGNLDCGSGLLLIIRQAMDTVPTGEVLEIRSTELSVCEDLPAWCRMTNNPYLGWRQHAAFGKFFVRKGEAARSEPAEIEQARTYRWQCRARWTGGMTAKVYARNHSWEVGQPASFDLSDAAPSAVEYLLGALAGCLAMGFQIHASRQGIAIDELELSLGGSIENILVFLGLEQTGRAGFKEISGTLYVRSEAPPESLNAIWRHTLNVSPIASSLSDSVRVTIQMRSGY